MNGIYSIFRVHPKGNSIERNRMGRVHVTPDGLDVLEDYHNKFLRSAFADMSQAQDRLAHMMHSKYLEVRPWDEHLGDSLLDEVEEEPLEPYISNTTLVPGKADPVFEYSRIGMSGTHIIEAHGDHLILDGNTLSPAESKKIIENVAMGLAVLRYHRPQPTSTPHIPGTLSYLGKSEVKVADLTKDPMIPRLGNLYALQERSQEASPMVVALDINDFWRANEVGWKEGDEAIVAFGELVAKAASGDAYRDGGDGFVVFFDDRSSALTFLRELTESEKELPPIGGGYRITISAGVGETLDKARSALEIAKQTKYRDSSEQANDSVYVSGSSNLVSSDSLT